MAKRIANNFLYYDYFCPFHTANVGAAVAGILFFGLYVPNLFLSSKYETLSFSEKMSISLLFNMAMAFGSSTIGLYEGTGMSY